MRWSHFAVAAGVLATIFAFLGPAATVADTRAASATGLAVAVLVGIGVVLGADAVLAVAAVVAVIGYAIGGIRGPGGAAWAALSALVVVTGARICFDARRPARIAVGAQRAVAAGVLAAGVSIALAALALEIFTDRDLPSAWIVAGVAACALPLFLPSLTNRGPRSLLSPAARAAAGFAVAVVLVMAVVGGAVASQQREPSSPTAAAPERSSADEASSPRPSVELEPESPPPPGELLAAVLSTVAVLIALALLASNWFREQPLEFKPNDAIPGDGEPMMVGGSVDDPLGYYLDADDTRNVVDGAMRSLEEVADPRRAIRLAYSVLEKGFGDLDAARSPSESEVEYLTRLAPSLRVAAEAMAQLTDLFEAARFSGHEVTSAMRAQAVEALERVRNEMGELARDRESKGGVT